VGLTRDMGRRVELVSMDPHFHDITLGLYRQDHAGRPQYLIHTYSGLRGAGERRESITQIAQILGGAERAAAWLQFSCGSPHQAAARRLFLDSCKQAPGFASAPRPLRILDKKSGRNIVVTNLTGGVYQIAADGPEEGRAARLDAIVTGLRKLGELDAVPDHADQVAFPCGHAHDALVGLLLPRALNVRAILREEEEAGTRGLLVAPSQQK
jgi:hypothetical protein